MAEGENLLHVIVGHVKATVKIDKMHDFVVVKDLITAAILGTDFLQLHGLVLHFTKTLVTAHHN